MPRIDRVSGLPAYRQMAGELRRRIQEGAYQPGEKLPSERDLSERYAVSRPTVRQAIAELRTEGLVVAEHGRGLFVRQAVTIQRLGRNRLSRAERQGSRGAFLSDAAAGRFTPRVEVEVRREPADERIAALLHLDAGAEVIVRDRLMFADDRPVQLAASRLPVSLAGGTAVERADTGPGGIYARLEELGQAPELFDELVRARMPTPEEASALQLGAGTPVLLITRVAFAADSHPVEVNDMVLAADRYELVYELPS